MSIDAVVVGIRKLKSEPFVKLTLEDRPGGGPAGQATLRVLNTPELKPGWAVHLNRLIGKFLWGGSGEIMLGNSKIAIREGYTGIRLVEGWEDMVDS